MIFYEKVQKYNSKTTFGMPFTNLIIFLVKQPLWYDWQQYNKIIAFSINKIETTLNA